MNDVIKPDYSQMTADIVSAFVSKNPIPVSELTALMTSVHASVTRAASGAAPVPEPVAPTPAVPIKKSIMPDYIICLDDGKKFQSMRRHLRVAYGMTPEEYRAKWDLPPDYPMTAPNYSKIRSGLAKASGLGLQGRATERKKAANTAKKSKQK